MRKIYSLVLMATALLIGTNAWGQTLTVQLVNHDDATKSKKYPTLQAAIDAIGADQTGTITLLDDQELTQCVLIPNLTAADTVGKIRIANRERQHITIDLAGKSITTASTANTACIALIKGELNIIGEGSIERYNNGYVGNWNRGAIVVSGTDGMKAGYTGTWPNTKGNGGSVTIPDFCKVDRSKQEWSSLYIGKDVTVTSESTGSFGIGVQDIGSSIPDGFNKDFLGYTCLYTKDNANDNVSTLPLWNCPSTEAWSCFGVKIVIDGKVYGERRGINVLGSINQTPGTVEEGVTSRKYATYPFYDHYFPYVKIGKDANVYCKQSGISDDGNGGIYLGGWAVIDIEGTVHGQTGIMVKAGDVLVQDGSVYSDSPNFNSDGNYHGTVEGSGIFVTSSASYAGESSVTITGDSYIAGKGGCAIIDVCATSTSEQTTTAVSHIDITGGTIVAGGKGAISLGAGTEVNTDITGGIVDGKVDIGDAVDPNQRAHADVTDLLPNTTNYHTTVIEDEDGNKTIVVSKGGTLGTYDTWSNIVTHEGGNYTGFENVVIGDGTNTITQTLDKLEIISGYKEEAPSTTVHNQTLTIKNHATLQVNQLTMNGFARITVEAGGKLIVKGEQGIVAPSVNNIILESSESAQAIFLFHPKVQSNRHPNATVKLTSKGYKKANGQKVWQRFGVPSYTSKVEEGAVIRYSTDPGDNPVTYNYAGWIDVYDYSIDNWKTMPDADAFVPFQCYAASSVATEANQTVYTFKCPLMGNSDFTLPLNEYTEWNYYANSYMAPIDINEMLTDFVGNNANLEATVYVYRSADNWWDAINLGDFGGYFATPAQTTIDPMQAFIFRVRDGEKDAVINYKKHIYNPDPTTTPVAAPARNREVSAGTAMIEIAAADGAKDKLYLIESDNFSADYDNGYDAAKYMNESFNLFASVNDEKMAKVATDNLEGTVLGMNTKEQTSFTMTISHVNNINYAIRDNFTGTEIEMVEGATYMFSTAANANIEGRFEIVPVAKMPTAIENIEATAAAKGIYTVTGQFVGNDYHSLPNGIYVVDGKKIVK